MARLLRFAALLLTAAVAHGKLANYRLNDEEVGWSDALGQSECLFFGPMANGTGLTVDLTVTPPNHPVKVGISPRHECPASKALSCANGGVAAQSDSKGVLQFSDSCQVEAGSWLILSTADLSVGAQVNGEINLQETEGFAEVFYFTDEPLQGGQCLFYGPVGEHQELYVDLTTERQRPITVRVNEARECPPKENTYCGLDAFSMTRDGLQISTKCAINEGSWIILYLANKTDSTTVSGSIAFAQATRDLNTAIILGGICAAVFLIVLIVGIVLCYCFCCKKKAKSSGPKDEQFIAGDEVNPL